MTICKKWGAMIVAACCFLVGGTDAAWSRETPARGNNTAHITVNDTVYGVLHNHRSLMSIKENRSVLEHELNKARAGFGPRVDVTGEIGVGVLSDTTSRGLDLDDQWLSVGSVSAKLVQPIWDGFATRSRVRTAQATLDSVKARIFDTATSLDCHSQRNTLTIHMEMYLAAASAPVRRVASKALSRWFFESASGLAARCRP